MTHYAACLEDVAKLAEGREPIELSAVIQDFETLMLEAIEAEQGFAGKAVGDQIVASWGGIPSQSATQAALHACKAAVRQVKALAASSKLAGLGLKLNIGISSDDPGLCVELCRLCPVLDAQILISAATRALCAEALPFEEISSGHRQLFRLDWNPGKREIGQRLAPDSVPDSTLD